MALVFSSERWGEIRKSPDHLHAVLQLREGKLRPIESPDDFRVVRLLRREVEAGRESTLARLDGGRGGTLEELEHVATVVSREDVDVFGENDASWGRALVKRDVEATGFRSLQDLRGAWRARHPHAEFGRLIWFLLGDRRDRDVFVASTSTMRWGPSGKRGFDMQYSQRSHKPGRRMTPQDFRGQGDYTSSPGRSIDGDAPLLSPGEYEVLARDAAQRDVARALEAESRYKGESLAARAARLERGSEAARDGFAKDLRAITREKRTG